MFKGSIVALITPFKNNKLDEDCYISLIHHHLKSGTSGLVPAGTTGESPTLNHEEHERVIELCVKESKGKIPVIAGTGSNSTACAIASKPAEDFIFFEAPITNLGIKKKKSGLTNSLSIECFILFMYITALAVTSAPEPAVVGIAINLANLCFKV